MTFCVFIIICGLIFVINFHHFFFDKLLFGINEKDVQQEVNKEIRLYDLH